MTAPLRRLLCALALLAASAPTSGCDKNRAESIKLVNEGIRAVNAGSPEAAYGYFVRATRIDPENHRAYYEAALVDLYDKGRHDEGLGRLETAEKLAPHDRDVLFQIGRTHVVDGQREQGLRYLERAIAEDPNYGSAWYYKGVALSGLGRYAEADLAFREAIAINPHDVTAFRELGLLYEQFDAFDASKGVYDEGLRLNPDDPDLLNNLGALAIEQGQVKDAIALFERAKARGQGRQDLVFNLAFAYVADNNIREAYRNLGEYINSADPTAAEQIRIANMIRSAMLERLQEEKDKREEERERAEQGQAAPPGGATDPTPQP